MGTQDEATLSLKQQYIIQQIADYSRELRQVQFELLRTQSGVASLKTYQATIEDEEITDMEILSSAVVGSGDATNRRSIHDEEDGVGLDRPAQRARQRPEIEVCEEVSPNGE